MELEKILVWVTTPGAAWLAYWLINNVAWLSAKGPRAKRFWACGISAGLAIAAYLAQIAMQYQPAPVEWRAWIEALVLVGTTAFGLATLIHGAKDLPAERPAISA
jgi:hypothetical protein